MNFHNNTEVADLLNCLDNRFNAALNPYAANESCRFEFITELQARLDEQLVTFDASAIPTFSSLLQTLIAYLSPDETMECPDDPDALIDRIDELLSDCVFDQRWFCLLLTGMDAADEHWEENDFSQLRAWIDSCYIPACVILTDKPLCLVTERPAGSSPLNNIFRSLRLDTHSNLSH